MLTKKKNKRGALSISIIIFALGVIFVMFYALYTFQSKSDETKKELEPSLFLNKVYDSELRIRFYVKIAIDETIKEMDKKSFKIEEFNNKLLSKLNLAIAQENSPNTPKNSEYFNDGITQIINQINSESIIFEKGVLTIKFHVNIITKYDEKQERLLEVVRGFDIDERRVIEEQVVV